MSVNGEAPAPREQRQQFQAQQALALVYLIAASCVLLLLPATHRLLLVPAIAALAIYLLSNIARFPLKNGYAGIIQPAFVVLLFAVPLSVVPPRAPRRSGRWRADRDRRAAGRRGTVDRRGAFPPWGDGGARRAGRS